MSFDRGHFWKRGTFVKGALLEKAHFASHKVHQPRSLTCFRMYTYMFVDSGGQHLMIFYHHHQHPHDQGHNYHLLIKMGINQSVCRSSYLNTNPDTSQPDCYHHLRSSSSSSSLSLTRRSWPLLCVLNSQNYPPPHRLKQAIR